MWINSYFRQKTPFDCLCYLVRVNTCMQLADVITMRGIFKDDENSLQKLNIKLQQRHSLCVVFVRFNWMSYLNGILMHMHIHAYIGYFILPWKYWTWRHIKPYSWLWVDMTMCVKKTLTNTKCQSDYKIIRIGVSVIWYPLIKKSSEIVI